jgi:hypothetical protein
MGLLVQPDDLTAAALRRLRMDPDGKRFLDWLEKAQADRDVKNRPLVEGVQLRMGQGAALALAEIIGHLQGSNTASIGVLSDTRKRAG